VADDPRVEARRTVRLRDAGRQGRMGRRGARVCGVPAPLIYASRPWGGGSRAGWAEWAIGPRADTWAASCLKFSCRAGLALWAEFAAQHSPMSCSCRPRPDSIVLGPCSCRAKKSCFGPAHGPRAFWPSIHIAFAMGACRLILTVPTDWTDGRYPGVIDVQMGSARWAGTNTARLNTARERHGTVCPVSVPGTARPPC
jgi:hypothetical protein